MDNIQGIIISTQQYGNDDMLTFKEALNNPRSTDIFSLLLCPDENTSS